MFGKSVLCPPDHRLALNELLLIPNTNRPSNHPKHRQNLTLVVGTSPLMCESRINSVYDAPLGVALQAGIGTFGYDEAYFCDRFENNSPLCFVQIAESTKNNPTSFAARADRTCVRWWKPSGGRTISQRQLSLPAKRSAERWLQK